MNIVISSQLSKTLPERIAALTHNCVIVADENTHAAITAKICDAICAQAGGALTLLPSNTKPTRVHAESLIPAMRDTGFAVAIGSGTINDIVKYAAFNADVPYAVIATAPSMNGYTSSGASLLDGNFKHSFPASAPVAVFADIDILAAAPMRLIQAGLGDTLCRSTVEFDCLLSHYCLGTEYQPEWFSELREYEPELLTHSAKLRERDPALITTLFHSLIAGGNAMRAAKSSIPASQGEHMIAHTMEFLRNASSSLSFPRRRESSLLENMDFRLPGNDDNNTYHGEEIAVTTLTMAQLHAQLLQSPPILRAVDVSDEAREYLPADALTGYAAKQRSEANYAKINARLRESWAKISKHLRAVHVPPDILESALSDAGCPSSPEALGCSADTYARAIRLARFTRNRSTALDML